MDLAERLKTRIRRTGPITFHDYMQTALAAYYGAGPRIGGPRSDFSTSASYPAFRKAIARLVKRMPEGYRVVELGAGTGDLARQIAMDVPDVEYVTVDWSPALRAKQEEVPGVTAVESMDELDPAPSLVFGNEILDALPVSRVVGGANGELLECYVDVDAGGRFKEKLGPAKDPRLEARLKRIGQWPLRGQIFDVAPALEEFVRGAARLADPGLLVLIDYGEYADTLYASTKLNGTLATYKHGGTWFDPYEDVGARDITADVDFTAVTLAARDAGMEPFAIITQEVFLKSLGIDDLGLPDEARLLAGATQLGTAFEVFAATRDFDGPVPGFETE